MIIFKKGNLLESDTEALVNTVNTVGVMGKGIALQFKHIYQYNYFLYKKACEQKQVKIGEMFVVKYNSLFDNKIIINFPTKTHWKYPSKYSYIERGLISLKKEIIKRNIKSISIPALGCSNGGLDYNKVKPMIEKQLKNLDCLIYIYEPFNFKQVK